MRKICQAALTATVVGSVVLLGSGASGAEEQPTIGCKQETGDNTVTRSAAFGGLAGVNVTDTLNGGDADSSNTQQVCGLHNDDVTSTTDESEGGDGGTILGIETGPAPAP